MSTLKNILSVYKNCNKFPSLLSANFLSNNNSYVINSLWSINDLVTSKSKYVNIIFHSNDQCQVLSKSPPLLRDEEILMDVFSKSFIHRAICLERKNTDSQGKENKVNLIHLWSEDVFLKSINLTELDLHGPVYKRDFNFGNFQWIEDGKKLIYIAESKKSKKLSYFQNTPLETSSKGIQVGNQYKYKSNYGEQLSQVENPVVCILDVITEKIDILDSNILCTDATIGAVCPRPNGSGFIFTGYKNMAYNLGLIYCTQRCCDLFYYDFESRTITKIGDEDKCKMSPIFSPDSNSVIWLENDAYGPHMQCQRLMRYELSTNITTVIIDVVRDSVNGFPGLYNLGMVDNCFTRDGRYLFLTSLNQCRHKILLVDIQTGSVETLESLEPTSNETLLDVNNRFLLVKVSSVSVVPYLALVNLEDALLNKKLSLVPVSTVHRFDDIPQCQILDHEPTFEHPIYEKRRFQSIYVPSKGKAPRPLILMLHGGPHSAFSTEFTVFTACAIELGYNVLMVNYRGSWGFGQNSIESLTGFIGEMDVSDCIKASEDVHTKYADKIDPNGIYLYGGSHGGFLGAHLSAKYSNKVKATVIRNPVINMLSMLGSTDIPDWIYTESGLTWQYNQSPTNEQLINIWSRSPLRSVDDIKCPVLLMIGQEDKRVPPSQGLELYKNLLARSVQTELYVYPKDSHPLSSVEASSDCFVNIMLWFDKHSNT